MKALMSGILCFTFLMAGCYGPAESVPPTDAEITRQAYQPTSGLMRFYSASASLDVVGKEAADDLPEEERRAYSRALMRAHVEALSTLGALAEPKDVPDQQDLAAYQDLLVRHQGEAYHPMLEQSIAFLVLDTVFPAREGQSTYVEARKEPLTDEELQAVSFATCLLVKNENPTADLILAALKTLDGYWSPDEIASSASQTLRATATWLDEACPTCDDGIGKAYPELSTQQQRHRAIFEATQDLADVLP